MKNFILKLSMVVSKILEVVHWVCVALLAVLIVLSFTAPDFLISEGIVAEFSNMSIGGFSITCVDALGNNDVVAFRMFAIGAFLIIALTAMIIRNIFLILRKTSAGTPFVKDNVRMVKEIGIFSIAIPVVGFIVGIITRLVCGVDAVEVGVDFYSVIIGLVMLCLTQVFAHGVKLEEDVDGLL